MHIANLSIADALKSLDTSEQGLSTPEAGRRLAEYGANHIAEIGGEPQWKRFLREFTHFFAIILWVAAGLAFFAESQSPGEGMWQLAIAIVVVILINGTFSYWQDPYLVYVLFRVPLPLTIIQILAVDLGTDMVPALALGAERPDPGVMQQPPRRPDERLLSWTLLARA